MGKGLTYHPDGRVEGLPCQFARRVNDRRKGVSYIRTCRKCWGCRTAKREQNTGQLLSEALVSQQVWFATYTYENGPDGTVPEGAVRCRDQDMVNSMQTLARSDHPSRRYFVNEYGSVNGRNHLHGLLFLPLSATAQSLFETAHVAGDDTASVLAPFRRIDGLPYVICPHEQGGRDFGSLCDDPNVIVVTPGRKRQTWQRVWWWPHGSVTLDLVWSAGDRDIGNLAEAISYTQKYAGVAGKDPWKDSRKFNRIAFVDLPPWVQQMTHYGPWKVDASLTDNDRWVRRNSVREDAIQLYRDLRDGHADLPLEEHPYVQRVYYQHQPPLGTKYHELEGRRCAANFGELQRIRRYQIGGYMVRKKAPSPYPLPEESEAAYARRVQKFLRSVERDGLYSKSHRWFYQTDAQHAAFGRGYNLEAEKVGRREHVGPDFSFQRLESVASRAKRMRQGAFFVGLLERSSSRVVRQWCVSLRQMGRAETKGLVSDADWFKWVVPFSDRPDIPTWADEPSGFQQFWTVGDFSGIGFDSGKLVYVGYLDEKRPWWRCDILTKFDLEQAVAGKLPSRDRSVASYDVNSDLSPVHVPSAVRLLNAKFPKAS